MTVIYYMSIDRADKPWIGDRRLTEQGGVAWLAAPASRAGRGRQRQLATLPVPMSLPATMTTAVRASLRRSVVQTCARRGVPVPVSPAAPLRVPGSSLQRMSTSGGPSYPSHVPSQAELEFNASNMEKPPSDESAVPVGTHIAEQAIDPAEYRRKMEAAGYVMHRKVNLRGQLADAAAPTTDAVAHAYDMPGIEDGPGGNATYKESEETHARFETVMLGLAGAAMLIWVRASSTTPPPLAVQMAHRSDTKVGAGCWGVGMQGLLTFGPSVGGGDQGMDARQQRQTMEVARLKDERYPPHTIDGCRSTGSR